MAYEMVMPYHLHMPSYFLETFTEYPFFRTAPVGLLFFIFCFHYCILYSLGDNPVWCLKYLPKKEGFGKFIK